MFGRRSGVALIITLIMISVITFMAVTFRLCRCEESFQTVEARLPGGAGVVEPASGLGEALGAHHGLVGRQFWLPAQRAKAIGGKRKARHIAQPAAIAAGKGDLARMGEIAPLRVLCTRRCCEYCAE